MTKFPKSVLEERRAASLKLLEAIDAYEKAEHVEDSVSVIDLMDCKGMLLTDNQQSHASTRQERQ